MKYFVSLFVIINISVSLAQFWICSKNEDCLAESATCVNNICQCPLGEVYSLDGSQCLELGFAYDSPCVEDQQCGWLMGAHQCDSGKCRCAKGWVYQMGTCIVRAFPNKACAVNDQCYDGLDPLSMVCKEGICECNDGYYLRGNYDCRPISDVGEYCSLNSDCEPNATCQNSYCTSTITTASSNRSATIKEQQVAVFVAAKLDVQCASNVDCADLPNSLCNTYFQKCLCMSGYRFDGDKCVPEIGTNFGCIRDRDCPFKYTSCMEGKCNCRKSYFTVSGNTVCQKPITHDNFFCNNDERCYVFGSEGVCVDHQCECSTGDSPNNDYVCELLACQSNSDCSEIVNSVCTGGLCRCPPNFHNAPFSCVPELGAPCSESAACSVEHSICNENVCQCKEDYVQNGIACAELAKQLNGTCENSNQCSLHVNTDCINSKCQCIAEHEEINGKCLQRKKMGDTCSTASQCHAFLGENVVCRNGYCNCPVDMVPTETRKDCESSSNTLLFSYSLALLLLMVNFMTH